MATLLWIIAVVLVIAGILSLLRGQVLTVSQDAVIRDRQQDRSNDRALGTQNDTSTLCSATV